MPTFALVVAQSLLVIFASFVSGLTGFGSAIIFQTGWAFLGQSGLDGAGDLKAGVAITFLGSLIGAIYIGNDTIRTGDIRWDLVVGLTPGSIIFNFVGTAALATLNQQALKKCLGILFLLFACWQLYLKCKTVYGTKKAKQEALMIELEREERAKEALALSSPSSLAATESDDLTSATSILSSPIDETGQVLPVDYAPRKSTRDFLETPVISKYEPTVGERIDEIEWPLNNNSKEAQLEESRGQLMQSEILLEDAQPTQATMNETHHSLQNVDLGLTTPSSPLPLITANRSRAESAVEMDEVALDPQIADAANAPVNTRRVWSVALIISECKRLWAEREFRMSIVSGIVSGFLGGCFGTGGPPIMMLFSMISITKGEVRGTFAWASLILLVPKLISLLVFNIFQSDQWLIYCLQLPCTVLGTWLGNKAHQHIDVTVVMMILQGLVLVSTIALCDSFDGSAFGNLMLAVYLVIIVALAAFMLWNSSLPYRMLRKRPQLVLAYRERVEEEKAEEEFIEESRKQGMIYLKHEKQIGENGLPTNYSVWHP